MLNVIHRQVRVLLVDLMLTHLMEVVCHLLCHPVYVGVFLFKFLKLLLLFLYKIIQLLLFLKTFLKFSINITLSLSNLVLKPVLKFVRVIRPFCLEYDAILADAFGQVIAPSVRVELIDIELCLAVGL